MQFFTGLVSKWLVLGFAHVSYNFILQSSLLKKSSLRWLKTVSSTFQDVDYTLGRPVGVFKKTLVVVCKRPKEMSRFQFQTEAVRNGNHF